MKPFLNALQTAVPEHELPQDLVETNARRILGERYSSFERMAKTFKTSGVEKRYSLAPFEWFEEKQDWSSRNKLYIEGACGLFMQVANKALDEACLTANEIDVVVTVSTSGIATPSIDARVFSDMGLRSDIMRVPVFGLGCSGGIAGLGIAERLARANPGSNVLLVVLEACTLSFRSDRLEKADIIATVLFGDGAAACILSSDQNKHRSTQIQLGEASQHLWPKTLNIMGWDIDPVGMGVILDKSVPHFVQNNMKAVRDKALKDAGLEEGDIHRHVFHPGGAKVADAIEQALGLQTGTLDAERRVLRDYGNMSSPTALFVLKDLLEAGTRGTLLAGALGPGFSASFIPLMVSG